MDLEKPFGKTLPLGSVQEVELPANTNKLTDDAVPFNCLPERIHGFVDRLFKVLCERV